MFVYTPTTTVIGFLMQIIFVCCILRLIFNGSREEKQRQKERNRLAKEIEAFRKNIILKYTAPIKKDIREFGKQH